MITYDLDGRPRPDQVVCPRCKYPHGYVWGPTPAPRPYPNGGCPQCQFLWRLSNPDGPELFWDGGDRHAGLQKRAQRLALAIRSDEGSTWTNSSAEAAVTALIAAEKSTAVYLAITIMDQLTVSDRSDDFRRAVVDWLTGRRRT